MDVLGEVSGTTLSSNRDRRKTSTNITELSRLQNFQMTQKFGYMLEIDKLLDA